MDATTEDDLRHLLGTVYDVQIRLIQLADANAVDRAAALRVVGTLTPGWSALNDFIVTERERTAI